MMPLTWYHGIITLMLIIVEQWDDLLIVLALVRPPAAQKERGLEMD